MALGIAKGIKERRPRSPSGRPRFRRTLFEPLPMTGSGATLRAPPDGGGIFGGSRPLIDDREPGGHLAPGDVRTRSIVVLLPALNEANAVGSVIERIPMEALRRYGYAVYVWVVDGQSVDACTGMWAFREDCLQRFRLAAESFDLEADIFASACEVGARLRELPVDYACRIGEAKLIPLRTGLLIAWRLLMKRLNARDLVGPEHRNVPAQAGRAVDQ